jgi:hypothetical protein
MDFRDNGGIPPQLEATRRRFEQWRQKRQGRCPIPDSLWAPAVKMARIYGVCRTAKVLRLGYYALKKRLQPQTPPPAAPAEAASRRNPLLPNGLSWLRLLRGVGAEGTLFGPAGLLRTRRLHRRQQSHVWARPPSTPFPAVPPADAAIGASWPPRSAARRCAGRSLSGSGPAGPDRPRRGTPPGRPAAPARQW